MRRGELYAACDSRALRKPSDDPAHIVCTEILCSNIDRSQVFPQWNVTACGFETRVCGGVRFLRRLWTPGGTSKSRQQQEANEAATNAETFLLHSQSF